MLIQIQPLEPAFAIDLRLLARPTLPVPGVAALVSVWTEEKSRIAVLVTSARVAALAYVQLWVIVKAA